MNQEMSILKSIDINARPAAVWDTLINPEKIKEYFTDAETLTDWKIGSEIVFIHIYKQKEFRNKGVILNFIPDHLLRYTYWTAFSNCDDKPENYTTITYDLTEIITGTKLTLTQTNFKNTEWYKSLEIGWDVVLAKMKEISER